MPILYDIINTATFAVLAFLFMGIFFSKKDLSVAYKALLLILWMTTEILVVQLFNKYLYIKCLLDIIITIPFTYLLYKASYLKIILLSIIQFFTAIVFEFLAYMIVITFSGYTHLLDMAKDTVGIYGGVISQMLYLITITILMYIYNKDDYRKTSPFELIKFSVVPLVTCSLVLSFVYYTQGVDLTKQELQFYTYLSICFTIVNIYMFWLLKVDVDKRIQLENTAIAKEHASELRTLYQQITSEHKEISSIEHEYKNKLSVINALVTTKQYEKLENFVINNHITPVYTEIVDTGNTIASAIINAKYAEATRKIIQIRLDIDNLSNVPIDDDALVIILTNLFNNAIEACEKLDKERIIQIKIKCMNNLLFISFTNTIGNSNINIKTTSKDDHFRHGHGLQNVKRIVDLYEGELVTSVENNTYSIKIMINT